MFVFHHVIRRFVSVALGAILALSSVTAVVAGQPVSGALNPQPPDFYSCRATGDGTICRASTSDTYADEATGIMCGSGPSEIEILDSGTRLVDATRYYDRNGNLTRRARTFAFRGAHLSNPLTGTSIYYKQQNVDRDDLAVPGDFGSATTYAHGVIAITVPGSGAVLLEAGRTVIGPGGNVESQAGRSDVSDYFAGQTEIVANLCAALGG